MLNLTMLKRNWKANWKLWTFFTILLMVSMGGMLFLYDPQKGLRSTVWLDEMPENLILALGINLQDGSLTGFLASYVFGALYLILPMCYSWILANRLVAVPVQNGMMSFYLSVPEKRRRLIFTQAYALWISLLMMFACAGTFGLVWCMVWYPGMLEIPQYLLLCGGAFFLHLCISGICFCMSCICDEVKVSVMTGTGLTLLFYLFCMISRIGGSLELLKYVTVFSFYSTEEILAGALNVYWKLPAAAFTGIILCMLGAKVFEKKDLAL